jgi:2-hydroxy-6-oxonona-2,4-dienedioate hydrolase
MQQSNSFLYNQTYIDQGQGEPIILLNGLFGNLSSWKPVVDQFSKEYRVIVPRLPIFNTYLYTNDLDRLSSILNEFLDWHQLSDVTLVGHSAGGHLAISYALRNSQNIKRLILTGSSGWFDQVVQKNIQAVSNYELVYDQINHRSSEQKNDELAIEKHIRDNSENVFSSLHKIKQPVLLAWGLQDDVTPPEIALHFHDLFHHSELKFIDKCGHVPMTEQPLLFNQYLNDFLNSTN